MRRILFNSLVTLGIAALAWVALVMLSPDRDPQRALARRNSPVVTLLREPRPDLGARVERWRLVTSTGDTLTGLWRGAPPRHDAPWTLVLLGGIGTDDRAALVVPPEIPAHVLAMSWPWRGSRRMSTLRFLAELPAIREACLRAPAVLAAGAAVAARQPDARSDRVAILGASLGVTPAIAAMSLVGAPHPLLLVDGGADLDDIVRHELRRQRVPAPIVPVAARAAAWLLAPLEPSRHASAARSRRVLMFNARRDDRLPPGAAERLHALLPHARIEWREAEHIQPGQAEVIASITSSAVGWLENEGPTHPGR